MLLRLLTELVRCRLRRCSSSAHHPGHFVTILGQVLVSRLTVQVVLSWPLHYLVRRSRRGVENISGTSSDSFSVPVILTDSSLVFSAMAKEFFPESYNPGESRTTMGLVPPFECSSTPSLLVQRPVRLAIPPPAGPQHTTGRWSSPVSRVRLRPCFSRICAAYLLRQTLQSSCVPGPQGLQKRRVPCSNSVTGSSYLLCHPSSAAAGPSLFCSEDRAVSKSGRQGHKSGSFSIPLSSQCRRLSLPCMWRLPVRCESGRPDPAKYFLLSRLSFPTPLRPMSSL